jgi:hypothetical protein
MFPSILHEHLVEFTSQYLPSLRAFVRIVFFEAKRFRELSVFADKLDSVLFGEVTGLHFVQQTNPLDRSIAEGNERFSYVEARKVVSLENGNLVTSLS